MTSLKSVPLVLAGFCLAAPCFAYDGRTLVFDAYRSGTKIGTHTLRFTQQGEKLVVDIAIDLKGKAFFIPFSYTHRNREVWQNNKLLTLESKTISNGKTNTLVARAEDGLMKLLIDGKPAISPQLFSTSYWNADTIKQARLLNSQKGEVIDIKSEGTVAVRSPKASGSDVPATEYRKTGSRNFNINVQYDPKGCLVGMNFKAPKDVARISYKLVTRPDAALAPDLLANAVLKPCLEPAKSAS
jgi:hypothetical protein